MYPTDGSGTTETNDIFNSGLFLLLTDIDAFIDFNKNGTWATNEDFNETLHADHGAGLSAATATLYTTVLLRLNGFNVTAGNTYSQADFHSVAGKDGACTVLDRGVGEICLAGVPGGPAYFWSGDTHRVYDFRTSRNLPKTPPKTTLLEIYNDTYADILTMFDGGYNCTLAGHTGALLGIYTDGTMDFQCFSSLPFQIPGRSSKPSTYVQGTDDH